MARRRRPLGRVQTLYEALKKNALELATEMAEKGTYGRRQVAALQRRFPALNPIDVETIFQRAKAARNTAQRIQRGTLTPDDQARMLPINPSLRRAYRYLAQAEVQVPGQAESRTIAVYIDSSRALSESVIFDRINDAASDINTRYFRGGEVLSVHFIGAERRR